jgi:hypothetical protein
VPDDHNITPVEPFQVSSICCANELGDVESASVSISGLQTGEGRRRAAWPALSSSFTTPSQHQPPCQPPWTNKKFVTIFSSSQGLS